MSSYQFTSSINTDQISKDSFDSMVSMFAIIEELYVSLYDAYGNPKLSEELLNEVLNDFKSSMRTQLEFSVSTISKKSNCS